MKVRLIKAGVSLAPENEKPPQDEAQIIGTEFTKRVGTGFERGITHTRSTITKPTAHQYVLRALVKECGGSTVILAGAHAGSV